MRLPDGSVDYYTSPPRADDSWIFTALDAKVCRSLLLYSSAHSAPPLQRPPDTTRQRRTAAEAQADRDLFARVR